MSKILFTGTTGFIGSHLAELFVENTFDVVAFGRYNSNNYLGCQAFQDFILKTLLV